MDASDDGDAAGQVRDRPSVGLTRMMSIRNPPPRGTSTKSLLARPLPSRGSSRGALDATSRGAAQGQPWNASEEDDSATGSLTSMPKRVHKDFRLWLSSMPAEHFPARVLQTSLKLTIELPKGVRGKVLRELGQLDASLFDSIGHATGQSDDKEAAEAAGKSWRRLVYATTMMHAVLSERQRFGALGWNIKYDFSSMGKRRTRPSGRRFCFTYSQVLGLYMRWLSAVLYHYAAHVLSPSAAAVRIDRCLTPTDLSQRTGTWPTHCTPAAPADLEVALMTIHGFLQAPPRRNLSKLRISQPVSGLRTSSVSFRADRVSVPSFRGAPLVSNDGRASPATPQWSEAGQRSSMVSDIDEVTPQGPREVPWQGIRHIGEGQPCVWGTSCAVNR